MKTIATLTLAMLAAPALAQDRGLGAHEHGHGALNIAFEGDQVVMELEAPGADIVGFEHEAKSAEDKAAIADAIAVLSRPLDLFTIPAGAGCAVVSASVELVEEGEEHDEHGDDDHGHGEKHDDHAHDDHAHDDHGDEHKHDDHAHDDHAGEKKHDDHDDHAHDDHSHEEHAEGGHTEFHAEYAMTCSDPAAITEMGFAYFSRFPNAEELEIQLISDKGAKGLEVERDEPVLNLSGAI